MMAFLGVSGPHQVTRPLEMIRPHEVIRSPQVMVAPRSLDRGSHLIHCRPNAVAYSVELVRTHMLAFS
jgi:hypothetical protein